MKTTFLGLVLLLSVHVSFAQEQKTSFEKISFVTTAAGMSVELDWKKGDEDISYFIVERSTDGIDFKQCGIVFLSEDPDFVEYKFRDKISLLTNGLVYRVGLVNTQNRLSYLPIKRIAAPASF
ncbi:MAG: hypothetical protein M3Y85_02820 [Bacteroidota bacterium]|nr:hypothetical protein [Bacteroidota bacterium]